MLNHGNKPKIIEINADYPDGIILHDATFSVLSGIKNSLHQENFFKLFDKNKNILRDPQNNLLLLDGTIVPLHKE